MLLHTPFSSVPHIFAPQAYPDWFPGNNFPGLTGATQEGTLGYPPVPGFDSQPDAVYRLTFTVPHDDGRLAFHFIKVMNKGPGIATDVQVLTGVSDQFNLTTVRCGQGTGSSDTCELGAIAPGATVTSRFTANVCCFVPGESRLPFFHATAEASSTDPQPNDSRATVTTPIVGDPQ